MGTFRVGLSADFRKPDGSAAFPSFDLTPLEDNPNLDWSYVPVSDGRIAADDMVGLDALILLGARFDVDSFPGDGRLALIARFGVGYDNVDVAACDRNDVALTITPNGVRRPVAVAILTFILALSSKLMVKDRLTRQGQSGWAQKSAYMGGGLVGKVLGSVGVGNIGAEMFRVAQPLGMKYIANDPFADSAETKKLGIELVSIEEMFRRADYLAINCPLSESTEGLVNADRLAMMKPSAYLINTARGPIVEEAALIKALRSGQIAGAGLDVFEAEPSPADNPLFQMENVIVTPHALCWTDQCFGGIGADDIAAVKALAKGEVPFGLVNPSIRDNPRWQAKLRK
ncbi:MAG: NAD(P)-dependent oxidoreductase [Paracoccaceae bacterium]